MRSEVELEISRLNEIELSSYEDWIKVVDRLLKVAPRQQKATCTRLVVNIAAYNSANYFAIARLLAQVMDDKATVTRIERGTFELITFTASITDYSAVLLFLLTAVNNLTKLYASTQVKLWRDECRMLRIPFKDRKNFGKYGRTEAVRDSFFAQALEQLYLYLVKFFENKEKIF